MMPKFHFSLTSEDRLKDCHADLQTICRTVIQEYDHSVICGYRDEEAQGKAFKDGKSKLQWPDSKHNQLPSMAVDVAPYPIDWDNTERFHELAGHMLEVAYLLNINLEWGGHWKTFKDFPHYQLKT